MTPEAGCPYRLLWCREMTEWRRSVSLFIEYMVLGGKGEGSHVITSTVLSYFFLMLFFLVKSVIYTSYLYLVYKLFIFSNLEDTYVPPFHVINEPVGLQSTLGLRISQLVGKLLTRLSTAGSCSAVFCLYFVSTLTPICPFVALLPPPPPAPWRCREMTQCSKQTLHF